MFTKSFIMCMPPFNHVLSYAYRRVKFLGCFSRYILHRLLVRVLREGHQVSFCYEGNFTLDDILISSDGHLIWFAPLVHKRLYIWTTIYLVKNDRVELSCTHFSFNAIPIIQIRGFHLDRNFLNHIHRWVSFYHYFLFGCIVIRLVLFI
jgi:hypothetical protein